MGGSSEEIAMQETVLIYVSLFFSLLPARWLFCIKCVAIIFFSASVEIEFYV